MQGITDAAHLAFGLEQQAEHPCQGCDRRLAVSGLQLDPQHPPLHKFLHRCEGAELESAMRQITTTRQSPFSRPEALDGAAGHQDAAAAGEQGVNV